VADPGQEALGDGLAGADWVSDGVPDRVPDEVPGPPAVTDVALPQPAATTGTRSTVSNRARMQW
jgi:hypothetical protein